MGMEPIPNTNLPNVHLRQFAPSDALVANLLTGDHFFRLDYRIASSPKRNAITGCHHGNLKILACPNNVAASLRVRRIP
jgi:hypothetical protein